MQCILSPIYAKLLEKTFKVLVVIFNDESSFQSPIIISITDHKVLVIYTTIVKNLLYAER